MKKNRIEKVDMLPAPEGNREAEEKLCALRLRYTRRILAESGISDAEKLLLVDSLLHALESEQKEKAPSALPGRSGG